MKAEDEQVLRSATQTNSNIHGNKLFDNKCHIPDLVHKKYMFVITTNVAVIFIS